MKRKLMMLVLTLVMAFAMTAVVHAGAFNNTMGTAQSIGNGEVADSVFYPDDKVDWYKFTLEKNSFITIVAQAKSSDVGFYLNDGSDEDGFKFVSIETAGGTYGYYGQLNGYSLKAGTYYIKFIDVNPGPQGTGYEFQLTYKVDTSATPEGCAAKGHPFVNSVVTKKGTCSQFGETTLSCKCGQNKQVVKNSVAKDPSNHDGIIEEFKTSEATCKTAETHKKVCSACKRTVGTITVGSTIPHDYTRKFVYEIYLKSAATCGSPAIYYYQCQMCGEASPEKTFSSGTGTGQHKYVDATCTEGKHCSECKLYISNPLGHQWMDATCETAKTCSICQETAGTALGHQWVDATCKAPKTCSLCKKTEGNALEHTGVKTTTTKSTLKAAGKIETKCACGKVMKSTKIAQIKTVKLEKAEVVYTGKAQKVKVTVKDAAGKTIASSNYTVTYKNNTKVGKATATVKFKGNYKGTKSVTFKVVPKAPTIKSPVAGKKSVTVKWTKVAKEVTGYEVMAATNKTFTAGKKTATIKKAGTTSTKVTKLTSKKTYYVRVRAYKTVNGVKYYSNWSAVKSVKVK